MKIMKWLILLLLPLAAAEQATDAPALWRELNGEDGVDSLVLSELTADSQLQGTLRFQGDYPVADVKYQICEIGNACFASGLPLERSGAAWSFDTTDIPDTHPIWEQPYDFQEGQRIGVQFFVCLEGEECPEDFFSWHHFPEGFNETHPTWDTDFTAWSETHYFGVDVGPGTETTPAPLLPVLALIGIGAWSRRG